jgi:hypothetical protein
MIKNSYKNEEEQYYQLIKDILNHGIDSSKSTRNNNKC